MVKIKLKRILKASKMIIYSIEDDNFTVKEILHAIPSKIKPY